MTELIVDSFAGGGGASLGIELALGRSPDIAINHDAEAIALHAANHPHTRHYREDVWHVDPREATGGQPVGLMWLSPDCKHFSKAKGGKPVSPRVRGLAWVAVRWAHMVKPRVLCLENVEEFQTWGPLKEGRPDKAHAGVTFEVFVAVLGHGVRGVKASLIARYGARPMWAAIRELRRCVPDLDDRAIWRGLGYDVQWRELRACDFGAPTIRKRLFLIARCDGQPIVWPRPTHGPGTAQPWRTAAECLDFSIPTPSIFLTREEARAWGKANGRAAPKRPLAEATLRRIAAGLRRFVLDSPRPFVVQVQHASSSDAPIDLTRPMRTVTAHPKGGGFALVAPTLINTANSKTTGRGPNVWEAETPVRTITSSPGFALVAPTLVVNTSGHPGSEATAPLHTVTTGGHHALVAAFLAKHQTERNAGDINAASLFDPVPTVKTRDSNALVTSTLVALRGGEATHQHGDALDAPLRTVSAGGTHHAEVRAFMVAYYGNEKDGGDLFDPMRTVTSRERFGLVTVDGHDYAIADIGMRMLEARELYRAQGFPDSYRIDIPFNGKPMSKEAQVRMCGNSVCPPVAAAIIAANLESRSVSEVAA